ncbi:MAG: HEAT repeat domain-containing protein [Planctomycetota bacterium]
MRAFILMALAAGLVGSFGERSTAGVDDAKWDRAVELYKQDFKKKSVAYKKIAIESLPTNDERTIHFIIKDQKLLQSKNWWIRSTAAKRLAHVSIPDLRRILLGYAKDPKKEIREGVIAALGKAKNRLDPPTIIEALNDKTWEVRRMACFAAGAQRIKDAVPKMISMLHSVNPRTGDVVQEGESNSRVHSVLLFNLEEITGQVNFGADLQQWTQYWKRNKHKQLPRPNRFDVGTFAGVELKFNDTFARRGSGPLIIALPMTNKSTNYYIPYFNQWMFVKWIFINLPPIRSFPNVKYNKHGDPEYPVDILVEAFEEMRKKRNVDRMAVLAHGFSTWIAAKYAQKYPDKVSGLIMMNPYASNDTYSYWIDIMRRSGDPDEEFWAKVSSYQIKMTTPKEQNRYSYVVTSSFLKNKADLEISFLQNIWRDPGGSSIAIVPFDIRGDATSRTPALMFFPPKKNRLSGFKDIKRMKKYYTKNITASLKKSTNLPFMEEPALFEKALRAFTNKYLIPDMKKVAAKAAKARDKNK